VSDYECLLYEEADGIATVTLNRPDKHNSFSPTQIREIEDVWKKLRFNDYYQDSQVVNRTAFDWLDARGDERFFLFLHYMDPHDPYFEHPYNGVGIARASTKEPDAKLAERMRSLYRGEIEYHESEQVIVCLRCGYRYPVRDGIPVMLVDEAEKPTGKKRK